MTETVKAALIAAVASVISALTAAGAAIWRTRSVRDRRKAHRRHPYGERRRWDDEHGPR